jgi:hypothetical protein
MAFTPYQLFLAGLMLVTGSINTLSTKWADRYCFFLSRYFQFIFLFLFRQTSHFCDGSGENVTFEHPFLQVNNFFIN